MKADFPKELQERVVKSFMDMLILTELENESAMCGHDVITFIHKEFGILVSSGTVYSILYSLERNKLVKGIQSERKRIYRLTVKGEKVVKAIMGTKEELHRLIVRVLRIESNVL